MITFCISLFLSYNLIKIYCLRYYQGSHYPSEYFNLEYVEISTFCSILFFNSRLSENIITVAVSFCLFSKKTNRGIFFRFRRDAHAAREIDREWAHVSIVCAHKPCNERSIGPWRVTPLPSALFPVDVIVTATGNQFLSMIQRERGIKCR